MMQLEDERLTFSLTQFTVVSFDKCLMQLPNVVVMVVYQIPIIDVYLQMLV